MKITFVIDSLTGGGAQRAAVLLIEGLISRNYQVSLITIYGEEADFYQLPQVNRIALKVEGASPTIIDAVKNNIDRFRSLKKAIDLTQPDLVISFLDKVNVLTLIACLGKKYPILVSEQNDPSHNKIGRMWHTLRRLLYPMATKVISCSKGVDSNWYWLKPEKRAVIYNPLAVISSDKNKDVELPPPLKPEYKTIVAMGRLTEQKGFDLLLNAFASITKKHPDWQLLILGEGELRPDLEAQINNLKLQNTVAMPGIVKNPFPLLKKCDLFVLSSRYEGFGNVIIEAIACDLPVISTDCPSGPNEIITDGETGILVTNQDRESLATAMSNLMNNSDRRTLLATKAKQSLYRFELDNIVQQWEKLFSNQYPQGIRQSAIRGETPRYAKRYPR